MTITFADLRKLVLQAAKKCVGEGLGYSQEKQVFDEVRISLVTGMGTRLDHELQQAILTCWHDLFREGTLSWGLNVDNPGAPFFHLPDRSEEKTYRIVAK